MTGTYRPNSPIKIWRYRGAILIANLSLLDLCLGYGSSAPTRLMIPLCETVDVAAR